MPPALAAFQRHLPEVALDVTVVEIDEAISGLHTGTIDVAVVVETFAPGHAPSDGLARRHLLADPFRMVIPRGHRFAACRTVDLGALAGERWIGVNSCPGYCQQVVSEACRRAGFEPCYGLEADEYPTAQGFVAAGLGVALIPLLALGRPLTRESSSGESRASSLFARSGPRPGRRSRTKCLCERCWTTSSGQLGSSPPPCRERLDVVRSG